MGASGWEYRVPFAGSLQQTLLSTQRQIIGDGDFIWPWDEFDPDYLDDDPVPRPTSVDSLATAKADEVFWTEGTHTLLDVERVCGVDDDEDFAAVRPLRPAELISVFGSEQPTRSDFDRVHSSGDVLDGLLGQKWSGRTLVIFDGDEPAEAFFWGWSGD